MLAVVALSSMLFSCNKERNCSCRTTDIEEPIVQIVNADNRFKCKKIVSIGVEKQVDGSLVREMHDVECGTIDPKTGEVEY